MTPAPDVRSILPELLIHPLLCASITQTAKEEARGIYPLIMDKPLIEAEEDARLVNKTLPTHGILQHLKNPSAVLPLLTPHKQSNSFLQPTARSSITTTDATDLRQPAVVKAAFPHFVRSFKCYDKHQYASRRLCKRHNIKI